MPEPTRRWRLVRVSRDGSAICFQYEPVDPRKDLRKAMRRSVWWRLRSLGESCVFVVFVAVLAAAQLISILRRCVMDRIPEVRPRPVLRVLTILGMLAMLGYGVWQTMIVKRTPLVVPSPAPQIPGVPR